MPRPCTHTGCADEDEDENSPPAGLQRRLTIQLESHRIQQLQDELKALPPVSLFGGQMVDPRFASWTSVCDIARAFVPQHPSSTYNPSPDEFREMCCTYLGAHSPLAAKLGIGRTVRSCKKNGSLPLDVWGFALPLVSASGDDWRKHHDALAEIIFSDAKRAGLDCSTEVRTLFSDLLPSALAGGLRSLRSGIIPDAVIRTALSPSEPIGDRLFDFKLIHFGRTRYPTARLSKDGTSSCADHRADAVPREYEAAARKLDGRFHATQLDPEQRPILSRLRTYETHGLCVGAFGETDLYRTPLPA